MEVNARRADSLLNFLSTRPQDGVTTLRRDELGDVQPRLAPYPPQKLRFYAHLCDDLGLLRGFVDEGEVFSIEGVSRLARLREVEKHTLWKEDVGHWLYYFVLCFVLGLISTFLRRTGAI